MNLIEIPAAPLLCKELLLNLVVLGLEGAGPPDRRMANGSGYNKYVFQINHPSTLAAPPQVFNGSGSTLNTGTTGRQPGAIGDATLMSVQVWLVRLRNFSRSLMSVHAWLARLRNISYRCYR